MDWKWGKVESFDDFLNEFEKYIDEYFTKQIILVNRVKLRWLDSDVMLFEVSTPAIDIILKVFVPDKVIMDSYFTDHWMGGDNYIYDDWNGMMLSDEQFNKFMELVNKIVKYYEMNKSEFKKARAEAFMNLIVETKGKIIDAMVDGLGEDIAAMTILNEMGGNE